MSVVALERVSPSRLAWPVALQLARREGRRFLRHPLTWVGGIFSLTLFGFFTWHLAPVLHRDDSYAAGALLPLAATTLIVANLAAARAARDSTEELYDTAAAAASVRTLGHLLSLAWSVAFGVALMGVMFAYMFLDSPVGTPNLAELASGPLALGLFGVVGIAIGRWKPHPALGPFAVVVAVALETLLIQSVVSVDATNTTVVSRAPWIAPWVPMSLTGEVPRELVIRPVGWHVLYLCGLIAVVAAVALARSGRRTRLLPLVVVGTTGIVVGAVGQFTPATAAQRAELAALLADPEEHQVCEERREVTYCAYPAYAPWIERWAAPVEGALDRIPPEARPTDIVVRQTFGSYFEGPIDVTEGTLSSVRRADRRGLRDGEGASTIRPGIRWGRGSTEGGYALGLSLSVAMRALDFPTSRAEMIPTRAEIARFEKTVLPTIDERFHARAQRTLRQQNRRHHSCTTIHQARALAAMWIAAQATPATRAAVASAAAENPYGLRFYENKGRRIATYIGPYLPLYPELPPPMWDRITFGDAEFHYAAQLLREPEEEVAALLAERWDDLSEPTTSTESVLDDLGLSPLTTIAGQISELPEDVSLEHGRRNWNPDGFFVQVIPCF